MTPGEDFLKAERWFGRGSRSAAFAEALAEQEIPCAFEESSEFFQTIEISVALGLLSILDNPRQDVPLISVLRSPVFGFSADRLAEIRGKTPVGDFYDAVKAANPTALFSVSCQGSIENNYNLMYADVEKWCSYDGYLDYIVPQIYYGFDNSTQPYSRCLTGIISPPQVCKEMQPSVY